MDSIISMVMGSTSATSPMEPTSCMACKNSFASFSGQDGWFFIPVLMSWCLRSTCLKSLRFHSSQCAVFSHSAYVETSESWLSIHGSQMHYLRYWASSGVARLLSSRGSSSAVSIPSNRSVDWLLVRQSKGVFCWIWAAGRSAFNGRVRPWAHGR